MESHASGPVPHREEIRFDSYAGTKDAETCVIDREVQIHMLVIQPNVKKHYDETVAFAKQQGLYDIVSVPEPWQMWLTEAGERRLVIALHENKGTLEIEAESKGTRETGYMVSAHPRPLLKPAANEAGVLIVLDKERAERFAAEMGARYRVVPVEVTAARETWAIEVFKQKFRPECQPEGIHQTLNHNLHYLDTYAEEGERGHTRCHLHTDFAPHSFTFVMERREEVPAEEKMDVSGSYKYVYWFNGGLICHGAGQSGVHVPQLCVRTGDTSRAGWSVNT